jgi:Uma2 family endonuclease
VSSETVPPPPDARSAEPDVPTRATIQEYFALERTSDVRQEYVDGEILAMAGETPTHNRIARNICVNLENSFETRPCESFIENVRTRVTPTKYRYPDIAALCGEAMFDQEKPPSLLNPQVIFEVLSPSTEGSDRDEKFTEYRQLDTLTDYVLVAQDRVEVTHYARQSARQWMVTIYVDLNDALSFPSLEVSLTLADLYRKTVLAAVG